MILVQSLLPIDYESETQNKCDNNRIKTKNFYDSSNYFETFHISPSESWQTNAHKATMYLNTNRNRL